MVWVRAKGSQQSYVALAAGRLPVFVLEVVERISFVLDDINDLRYNTGRTSQGGSRITARNGEDYNVVFAGYREGIFGKGTLFSDISSCLAKITQAL